MIETIFKSTYNFRFNESNFRPVDLKLTILKAPKVSNWSEVKTKI